jgi:hypothetical protein
MQEVISLTAKPKEKTINVIYVGKSALCTYLDMDLYKLDLYKVLEEILYLNDKGEKRTSCSISSGRETKKFRGKLKLTGRGWEIVSERKFEHSGFDIFGALLSDEIDKIYMEVY